MLGEAGAESEADCDDENDEEDLAGRESGLKSVFPCLMPTN